MKRRALLGHLTDHACSLRREGAKHSIYENTRTGKKTAVPRHREIDDAFARKICRQLEIPNP